MWTTTCVTLNALCEWIVLVGCLSSAVGSCSFYAVLFHFKSQTIIDENSSIVLDLLLFAKYSLCSCIHTRFHSLSPSVFLSCFTNNVCALVLHILHHRKSVAKFGQKALKTHFMHKCQNILSYSNPWSNRVVQIEWWHKWLHVSSAIWFPSAKMIPYIQINSRLMHCGLLSLSSGAMNLFDMNWNVIDKSALQCVFTLNVQDYIFFSSFLHCYEHMEFNRPTKRLFSSESSSFINLIIVLVLRVKCYVEQQTLALPFMQSSFTVVKCTSFISHSTFHIKW